MTMLQTAYLLPTADPDGADVHDLAEPLDAVVRLQAANRRLEGLATPSAAPTIRQFHQVIALIHEICDALYDAESAGVPPDELRALVAGARAVHAQSSFIRRLQEWPRGYPGDFETIERLWQAENHESPGTVAHAFETYALSSSIAQQHRNKVALQAACIRQTMAAGRRARILSIGCGSCPDLRSVADQATPFSEFVLCDSDPDALTYSRARLTTIAERCLFVQGMVPRVLRRVRGTGPFDLILAGGLFDYLSDRFIVRTLHESWHELLAPDGRILFTNIGRGNPFRVWLEYLANWRLIERSEADIIALCREAEIPVEPVLVRDATGLSIVAVLRKPAQ
jgi:extracellular factor (EF) 3-hydroxypalmitic acid methyl ester biosynthesis protein